MSTVAGGDTILAADNNDLENRIAAIEGRLTTTSATANAAATSGTTELAIDQVTATLVNGKVYKCTWTLNWTGTVAADQFEVRQRFGAGIAGTVITSRTVAINSQFGMDVISFFTAGSSGALTVQGTVQRTSGTGTMTVTGAATKPRYITIERMS